MGSSFGLPSSSGVGWVGGDGGPPPYNPYGAPPPPSQPPLYNGFYQQPQPQQPGGYYPVPQNKFFHEPPHLQQPYQQSGGGGGGWSSNSSSEYDEYSGRGCCSFLLAFILLATAVALFVKGASVLWVYLTLLGIGLVVGALGGLLCCGSPYQKADAASCYDATCMCFQCAALCDVCCCAQQ